MSFRFIDVDDAAFTDADASPLSGDSLAISGIFIGQTKQKSFMLGNDGSTTAAYQISTSGVNASINDDVSYSVDNGLTWETTAGVSGIRPNELSPRIRVRYTPAEGELLGVGSFLIKVNEVT